MILRFSGRSRPSALKIAEASDGQIQLMREGSGGLVNWGRRVANTELNPDISNTVNKRRMRELFAEHNVPMPKLFSAREAQTLYRYNHDRPHLIGRPDSHSKGRGLWHVYGTISLAAALRGTRKKKAATHFMEYIDAPREYRVHIFKGKSIRISEKAFNDGSKKDYTTAKPQHNVQHVRNAAKKAVEAVGLDFGTVDILAGDNQCWVLEVNAAPGLGGTMPKLWADTFLKYERGEWDE